MALSKVTSNSLSSGITTTFGAGAVGTPSITTTGDTNTGIFFPAADTIAFSEGGAESMRIDSSGRVGINTTSALGTLDTYIGAGLTTFGDFASSVRVQGGNDTNKYVPLTFGGYGDYAPAAIAYLVTTGTGNTKGALVFGTRDVTTDTRPTERMRIDSSGNVIVNATAQVAQGKFGVAFVGTTHQAASFNETSGASSWSTVLFQRLGTTIGSISNATSSTAYNTSSDYRLKENIAPMTGALAKVTQLKPVTYKWKIDGADGEGFIAHELAEVCPHAVNGEKDAVDADGKALYQGIDTSFLVATLTAAIQELKAINDTQAATITALTARIDTQAADIAELKTKVA